MNKQHLTGHATMLLAFVFLREPITWKKVLGIALGATGAVTIVLASAGATGAEEGNAVGDLIILTAQFCFACYLTAFKSVIHRYSGVTCMKWMFLFSLIFISSSLKVSSILEVSSIRLEVSSSNIFRLEVLILRTVNQLYRRNRLSASPSIFRRIYIHHAKDILLFNMLVVKSPRAYNNLISTHNLLLLI